MNNANINTSLDVVANAQVATVAHDNQVDHPIVQLRSRYAERVGPRRTVLLTQRCQATLASLCERGGQDAEQALALLTRQAEVRRVGPLGRVQAGGWLFYLLPAHGRDPRLAIYHLEPSRCLANGLATSGHTHHEDLEVPAPPPRWAAAC